MIWKWYENREHWLRNHSSLLDLATDVERFYNYAFKGDSFNYANKEDKINFLGYVRSKESRLNRKVKPKKWDFIWIYKLAKERFIKKFKEKIGNDDRVCHNFIRLYLDNVDDEYDDYVNGVILTPISYGRRYLLEEEDNNFEEAFY